MIVGIDLGTTNSLVAVWRDGKSVLIRNSLGEVLTPSCVSIDEDDAVLVGRAARERLQTHPERTAAVFKRYMGSDRTLRLGRREFRPEELSALVLKSLKADAEAALGEPVTEAVITVPAYFSDAQRKATRAAGQMAGLRVERLLNEPTAAALAYGMHRIGTEARFLVFDLGGGTFDVSILELFDGVMEVRASAGDNFLGGEDFVHGLVDLFFERTALPAAQRRDAVLMQRLAAQAEAAKRTLSVQGTASMSVRLGEQTLSLELDEQMFEQASAALLKRLRSPVERALRDANLRGRQLDNVVLAGGATRMPMIRRLVATMFGRFPAVEFNPDEVVALGAAVQAGLKAKDAALQEVVMTDVSPYSLGVEISRRLAASIVAHGHFDPIIERNTPVPVSRVKSYLPMSRGQKFVDLNVFQGEARMVKDNVHLGRLRVDLPRDGQGDGGVEVHFSYDVNGLLQVEARLQSTGESSRLRIEGNPGLLSEQEIAGRLRALAELKIHPRDTLGNRTLMARAERVYQQLRGEVRDGLRAEIVALERALATCDSCAIGPVRHEFEAQLDRIEREGPAMDGR